MITLRDYQQEIVDDTAKYKAIRGGRRVGKSTMLTAEILKRKQGVVGVFSHMRAINQVILDYLTQTHARQFTTLTKGNGPYWHLRIAGLEIYFYANPTPFNGRTHDLIVVDEAAFVDDMALRELFLVARASDTSMVMAGTPSKVPATAFETLAESDMFKQWHLPSNTMKWWSDSMENEMKQVYPKDLYRLEVLAEWPQKVLF